MKTTKSNTNIISLPSKAVQDAVQFSDNLKPVWNNMPANKAKHVQDEIRQLAVARYEDPQSPLKMGLHLINIYETCEPYSGAYMLICKSLSFSWRTAYRYMDTYKAAAKVFPETVLKAATDYGLKVLSYTAKEPLGRYTKAVKALPPPKNPTPAQATDYIVRLEAKQKEMVRENTILEAETPADKEELLRQTYRIARNALSSLKGRAKRSYLDSLVGMLLTEAGIASPTHFEPEAIPEDFRRGPGRPREAAVA